MTISCSTSLRKKKHLLNVFWPVFLKVQLKELITALWIGATKKCLWWQRVNLGRPTSNNRWFKRPHIEMKPSFKKKCCFFFKRLLTLCLLKVKSGQIGFIFFYEKLHDTTTILIPNDLGRSSKKNNILSYHKSFQYFFQNKFLIN